MGSIGNQILPGSVELGREIDDAKAHTKKLDIKTTGGNYSVAAVDVLYNNGTISFSFGGKKTVIPFHAVTSVDVH